MLKTADANTPAETHAVSLYKGAIAKNRISVHHTQKHRKLQKIINLLFTAFSATSHPQRKTLIAKDAILILAKLASKTIQQHRIRFQKRDATPHQQ
jgi:hypothetical protein